MNAHYMRYKELILRYNKQCRAARKTRGVCIDCQIKLDSNHVRCTNCNNVTKAKVQALVKRRLDAHACVKCADPEISDTNKRLCNACLAKNKIHDAAVKQRIKDLVFTHYGGYKCNCCGEHRKSMLVIDHTNNDGNIHRKTMGSYARHIVRWLYKNAFPTGFQVLCSNCNESKRRNAGTCEHLLEKLINSVKANV